MESVYAEGKKGKTFLVDKTPAIERGESSYSASFQIKTGSDLNIRGKGHVVYRLRQRSPNRVIADVFIERARAGSHSLVVRPRAKGKKKEKSDKIALRRSGWTRIDLEWSAASSPNAEDGSLKVWVQRSANRDLVFQVENLDNPDDRVHWAQIGQVSPGKKASKGSLFVDAYKSRWDD